MITLQVGTNASTNFIVRFEPVSAIADPGVGDDSVVADNMLEVTGDTGHFDPEAGVEHDPRFITELARLGCEAAYELAQLDAAN